MNIKFECFCGQPIEVNSSSEGQEFRCPYCGTKLVVPRISSSLFPQNTIHPPVSTINQDPPKKVKVFLRRDFDVGYLLLLIGLIVIVGSLVMETSIETSFGSVNNLGLMADRQNGLIVGFGSMVVGLLMINNKK